MVDVSMYERCVLVTGHFNVLHGDHVKLLEHASQYGLVTVGINGQEANVRKYGQAAVPLYSRIDVLEACRYVDEVMVFHEDTPCELIRQLRPDYLVKGPDYLGKDIPELPVCQELGVRILYRPGGRSYSASELLGLLDE